MEQVQRVNLAMTKMWSSLSHKYDSVKYNNETFVLKISAKDLAIFGDKSFGKTDPFYSVYNGDNFDKTDPSHNVYVVAFLSDESGKYKAIGQTEMLRYNPHLNWD